MKTVEQLIEFCESKGYGFSIARSSGGVRYTVFIHTTIMDEIEFDTISKFSQSLYLDDAIGMTIEKVKLIKVNIQIEPTMNTDSGTYKFSKSMIRKITYQQIRDLKVSRYDGNLVIEDLDLDLIGGEEMMMKEYKEEFGYWEGDEFLIASNAPSFEDFFMDNVHHFLVNNQDKLVKSNP